MLQVEEHKSSVPGVHDLNAAYDTCTLRFDILARDIRLMFLEAKLYRKYFVQAPRTDEKLLGLTTVLDIMAVHKQNTLNVLKKIHERENIVRRLRELASDFTRGRVATLEVQTKVLQLLWMHQQVTLGVVEAVGEWRAMLTRPYPFNWNGGNYFLKVLEDCAFIDTCQLNTVLPLHLMQFPLCSNVTSLSLFSPQQATLRPKSAKGQNPGGNSTEMQNRLVRGEKILMDEDPLQRALMRELVALSAKGYFVTVLNVQSVIPECSSGVHVTNQEWDGKLQSALGSIFMSYMGGQGGKDVPQTTSSPPGNQTKSSAAGQREEKEGERRPVAPPRPESRQEGGGIAESPDLYKQDDFESGED